MKRRLPNGGQASRYLSLVAQLFGALAAVAIATAGMLAVGVVASSATPTRLAQGTSGCVGVDGSDAPSGGPKRATVVVDTGSGPVWSACISFSGSISGIEALKRAENVIKDLDPVFDKYGDLGSAVCKLRDVGTNPPDCLGKAVEYWAFSHNGQLARVGAGAVVVSDGDVQGWRHGTGGLPRQASLGTRASSAPPTTTTRPRPSVTTTTRVTGVSPTTTRPHNGGGVVTPTKPSGDGPNNSGQNPGGSGSQTGAEQSGSGTSGAGDSGNKTNRVGSSTAQGELDGSVAVAGQESSNSGGEEASSGDEQNGSAAGEHQPDDSEQAAGASGLGSGDSSGPKKSSALASAVGFVAAIGSVFAIGIWAKRRHCLGVSVTQTKLSQ